ncbi:MAG: ribose-phosphate diphosphokinase [Chitinispirillaceae bacterium]|nr:ribose-phosphate diphosphokinase [Chitinispirillaceae bacterium]
MDYKERSFLQFVTPESFSRIKKKELGGPNGWLLFVACNSGIDFAMSVKKEYEQLLGEKGSDLLEIPLLGTYDEPVTRVFSDTETCPRLKEHVAGSDAFVFQCIHENVTKNTVNENIQQLLQVVRTLRAHRAKTITVVTPYTPYSRQDKPSFLAREATLASLFADQLRVAGAQTHLTYHPHTLSLYGFYEPEMMLVALSGLALFTEIFNEFRDRDDVVVVSTDAGGAKFTVHFSEALNIPYAIANKFRPGKDKANLLGIIGEMRGKKIAIILDDETVTGSSLANAARWLYTNFGVKEIHIAVSHLKIKEDFLPVLIELKEKYGLVAFHATDSIPQTPAIKNLISFFM